MSEDRYSVKVRPYIFNSIRCEWFKPVDEEGTDCAKFHPRTAQLFLEFGDESPRGVMLETSHEIRGTSPEAIS